MNQLYDLSDDEVTKQSEPGPRLATMRPPPMEYREPEDTIVDEVAVTVPMNGPRVFWLGLLGGAGFGAVVFGTVLGGLPALLAASGWCAAVFAGAEIAKECGW